MQPDPLACTLALTRIKGLSARHALILHKALGEDSSLLWSNPGEVRHAMPDLHAKLADILDQGKEAALRKACAELEWAQKHQVHILCYGTPEYPSRLLECDDAPLALFYMGNAPLNTRHALAVVGTRKCTEYGKDMCRKLIAPLAEHRPDTLIVSGLAYGIDIHAHRAALQAGLPTVAVLAHGLDRIYPPAHRDTAKAMLENGGLLTEYMTETTPDKFNFVHRNRIVAALADGCLVVESADKGGALITAQIAQDYHRDVMAVPGRVGDKYSMGCNRLIHSNGAALVTTTQEVLATMGWPSDATECRKEEPQLFPELSPEEQTLVGLLQGTDGKHINQLAVECDMPVHRVSALLFDLEMRSVVKALSGGCYRLLL